jgi:hypothetical protein
MSKQSSIEFLQECLSIHLTHEQHMQFDGLFQQAKAMHKEEIMDAHIEGQRVFDKLPHTQWTNDQAEQYYNELFNTKEK